MARSAAPDGGWGWVVMVATFFILIAAAGTNMCFGILLVEFIEYYKTSRTAASWIGSCLMLSFGLSSACGTIFVRKFGYRVAVMGGSATASLGFFLSFFVERIEMLYVTYGLIGGAGAGMAWVSSLVSVSEYFDKRRSSAFGFSLSGAAVGYLTFPPMYEALIEIAGWRACIILLACIWCQMCVFGALLRPLPPVEGQKPQPLFDVSVIKNLQFHIYCFGQILWTIPYFVSMHFIPDNCHNHGFSKEQAGLLISIVGAVMIPARLFGGVLANQKFVNRTLLLGGSCGLLGVVLFIYPHIRTYPLMAFFTVLIALAISEIVVLTSPVCADLFGAEKLGAAFGYSHIYDIVSSFGGPPLAGHLYDITGEYILGFTVVGAFGIISSCLYFGLGFWNRRKLFQKLAQGSGKDTECEAPFQTPEGLSLTQSLTNLKNLVSSKENVVEEQKTLILEPQVSTKASEA